MPLVVCKLCSSEFSAKPSWIKNGYGKYCSKECSHQASRTGRIVKCATCTKDIYKSPKALKTSKSKKYFCNKSCQTTWRNSEFKGELHANWKGGHYSYRALLTRHDNYPACRLCHTQDKRVLAVHHIDEDRNNNTIDNLAWLCHNCHHLVHHDSAEYKKFMAAIV